MFRYAQWSFQGKFVNIVLDVVPREESFLQNCFTYTAELDNAFKYIN